MIVPLVFIRNKKKTTYILFSKLARKADAAAEDHLESNTLFSTLSKLIFIIENSENTFPSAESFDKDQNRRLTFIRETSTYYTPRCWTQ